MLDNDKQIILSIIRKYIPNATIYLFGSRARQDHSATSDYDIAIDATKKIDETAMSGIRTEVDDSIIPFKVDLVDFHSISPEFQKKILEEGKLWAK